MEDGDLGLDGRGGSTFSFRHYMLKANLFSF
jgi:hypothetical protein